MQQAVRLFPVVLALLCAFATFSPDSSRHESPHRVIASQNPLRGKLGIRTVPNRHCEGAPRLWQSLTPEAFTNIRQILVLNSEAWQSH